MSLNKLPIRVIFLGFALFVFLSATAYLLFGRSGSLGITQELLRRQQVFSRAGASNLTSFFEAIGDSIVVMAQSPSVINQNAGSTVLMDAFVEQWGKSGVIGGVVLTDRAGVVRFNSNVTGISDTGESLADRDYFSLAKSQKGPGEYFVGQPVVSRLGATKGKVIIPVAAPVVRGGAFVGVVATSVNLEDLTINYLASMKITETTELYLVDAEGKLLYSNAFADEVGTNIFDHLEERPFLGMALNQMEEGYSKVEDRLVAYSPISLGTQNWLLVMSSPAREVESLKTPIYVRLTALMILVAVTTFGFGVITVREVKL